MKSKSSNLDQVSSKEHELGIVCSDDNSTIEGIIRQETVIYFFDQFKVGYIIVGSDNKEQQVFICIYRLCFNIQKMYCFSFPKIADVLHPFLGTEKKNYAHSKNTISSCSKQVFTYNSSYFFPKNNIILKMSDYEKEFLATNRNNKFYK